MNSHDEHVESDEHDEEEEEEEQQIDDNEVESEVEQAEDEESNQQEVQQNDDEQEEQEEESQQHEEEEEGHENNTPGIQEDEQEEEEEEEEEEEGDEAKTRDTVDPTNPLDEDSMEAAQNLTQEDVFGEELDDLSEDEDGVRRKKTHDGDLNDSQHGDEDELLEEQEEEEEQIMVDTPHVTCDLGRDLHLVKLPSFMKVETKLFEPEYFNDEIRDDDDEESKARFKLRLENTIRWRYGTNDDGETTRESNTRLVRWSDGSLSLHVGKEIFDVSKANIQNDHNHLFIRHQKSMEAQAVFRTKLSFRQHSNDSLAHLKLKFASKANPAPKVRVLSNIKAPVINSADMIKREEQRMKAEERRRNQQLRQRERAAYKDRNMSASYLEDRDEDDEDNEQESISAIKKNAKKKRLQGGYRDEVTSEDEDDDDPNEKFIGQRSSTSTKHRTVTASDDEQSDNEQTNKRKRIESVGEDEDEDEEQESD